MMSNLHMTIIKPWSEIRGVGALRTLLANQVDYLPSPPEGAEGDCLSPFTPLAVSSFCHRPAPSHLQVCLQQFA